MQEPDISRAQLLAAGLPVKFNNSFGTTYLTSTYSAHELLLRSIWEGFVTPEDIISSSTTKLLAMESVTMRAIINDNRTVEGPWYDANGWIEEYWLPRATKLGLKKLAMVLSPDAYAALSAVEMAERLSKHPEHDLETGLFPTIEEAEAWALT